MERSVGQRVVGAFVVGGIIGVFMQAIMTVVGMIVPDKSLVVPVSLVVLGLVGMVLVLCGAYKRIAEVGGFGAGIMFCGLVNAVSFIYMGGAMRAGGKASAGLKAVGKFAGINLGSIVVVGVALGALLAHTPGVLGAMDTAGSARHSPGMLVFLFAFLMGGLISVEGELLLALTRLREPTVILINAALGMVLSVFGVSTLLEVVAGGGLCATVVDAGASAVLGGALCVLAGTPSRALVLALVMALVVVMGIVCGNAALKRALAARQ